MTAPKGTRPMYEFKYPLPRYGEAPRLPPQPPAPADTPFLSPRAHAALVALVFIGALTCGALFWDALAALNAALAPV